MIFCGLSTKKRALQITFSLILLLEKPKYTLESGGWHFLYAVDSKSGDTPLAYAVVDPSRKVLLYRILNESASTFTTEVTAIMHARILLIKTNSKLSLSTYSKSLVFVPEHHPRVSELLLIKLKYFRYLLGIKSYRFFLGNEQANRVARSAGVMQKFGL